MYQVGRQPSSFKSGPFKYMVSSYRERRLSIIDGLANPLMTANLSLYLGNVAWIANVLALSRRSYFLHQRHGKQRIKVLGTTGTVRKVGPRVMTRVAQDGLA
jgi:hypothetical protein